MARSKSKVVYVHRSQFSKFFYNKTKIKLRASSYKYLNEKNSKLGPYYFFWKRSSTINRNLIGKRLSLYNGFLFHIFNVDERLGGYRFGEFTATRRVTVHKGKQRQIKKRDKYLVKEKVNKYSVADQIAKQDKKYFIVTKDKSIAKKLIKKDGKLQKSMRKSETPVSKSKVIAAAVKKLVSKKNERLNKQKKK